MKPRVIALSIFTMIIIIFTGCARVIEDYPSAVQWNDIVYLGSDKIISGDEIGNKIGSIKSNVSKFPKKTERQMRILLVAIFLKSKDLRQLNQ